MRFEKIDIIKKPKIMNLYKVKIDTSHSIIILPQIIVQNISLYPTIDNPFLHDFSHNPDYYYDNPLAYEQEIYGKIDFKIYTREHLNFIKIVNK